MGSILVIGSIMMDFILKIDRMPQEGESMLGNGIQIINGGKGANQAVAIARQEMDTYFCGKVGEDDSGRRLVHTLQEIGIHTNYISTCAGTPTGIASILLEKSGANRIIVNPGTNMKLTDEDVERAFNRDYEAVVLQLEIPRSAVLQACRLAKKKNIPVVLDAGPAQDFPLEQIAGLEILTPNRTEAEALTGIEICSMDGAKRAAEVLIRRNGARYVVIKMGEQGALLYDGKAFEAFPSYPVTSVDSTAAGDAFTGGMTVHYLKTRNIRAAVRFGSVCGALAVTKLGAQPSLPTLADTRAFIDEHGIIL